MNPYKKNRQEFFRKYFDYPSRLEIAIKKTEPLIYFERQISGAEVQNVSNFNNSKSILRLLNKHGYHKHFYWAYCYRGMYKIWSWARIFWEPTEGLFMEFEWLKRCVDERELSYEICETEWEFFYPKRRLLFSNFYPSAFLDLPKDHDFFILLTDERLNKMVGWS